jgi:hypothetical protein
MSKNYHLETVGIVKTDRFCVAAINVTGGDRYKICGRDTFAIETKTPLTYAIKDWNSFWTVFLPSLGNVYKVTKTAPKVTSTTTPWSIFIEAMTRLATPRILTWFWDITDVGENDISDACVLYSTEKTYIAEKLRNATTSTIVFNVRKFTNESVRLAQDLANGTYIPGRRFCVNVISKHGPLFSSMDIDKWMIVMSTYAHKIGHIFYGNNVPLALPMSILVDPVDEPYIIKTSDLISCLGHYEPAIFLSESASTLDTATLILWEMFSPKWWKDGYETRIVLDKETADMIGKVGIQRIKMSPETVETYRRWSLSNDVADGIDDIVKDICIKRGVVQSKPAYKIMTMKTDLKHDDFDIISLASLPSSISDENPLRKYYK